MIALFKHLQRWLARLLLPQDDAGQPAHDPRATRLQAASPLSSVRSTAANAGSASSRAAAANDAFTPTRPKPGRRQVIGREQERDRIVQAILEERAHVVLYSERGRGKTSLANLATEALRRQGCIVGRHTCEASSTFESVMRGLARDLPASLLSLQVAGGRDDGCEAALPAGPLSPRDIVTFPANLSCNSLVFVVDEFDRVEDLRTRTLLADTIKQISDRGIALAFLIVGVSENLEQIIGQHPSIQRNIVAVHLPLAKDEEIATMLKRGGSAVGLVFTPQIIGRVQSVARGMPYMAQLLGLRIAQAARMRHGEETDEQDFADAVERVLADAPQPVVGQLASLTDHGRDHAMVAALRAITTAPQDAWGRLTLSEWPGSRLVAGREIPQDCWSKLVEAKALRPTHIAGAGHVLVDRALMNHVLLRAARPEQAAAPQLSAVRG